MKKLSLLLLFITLFGLNSEAQVYKFRTQYFSSRTYNRTLEKWTKWSDEKSSSMLVSVNLDSEKITVYSEATQIYDIIKINSKVDSDGDRVFEFKCEDVDGIYLTVKLIHTKDDYAPWQLYVFYSNIAWMYGMEIQ